MLAVAGHSRIFCRLLVAKSLSTSERMTTNGSFWCPQVEGKVSAAVPRIFLWKHNMAAAVVALRFLRVRATFSFCSAGRVHCQLFLIGRCTHADCLHL